MSEIILPLLALTVLVYLAAYAWLIYRSPPAKRTRRRGGED
jgi:hypothetical protein